MPLLLNSAGLLGDRLDCQVREHFDRTVETVCVTNIA